MMIETTRITTTQTKFLPSLEAPLSVLQELYSLPNSIQKNLFIFDPIDFRTIKFAEKYITNFFHLVKQSSLSWINPYVTTKGDGDVSFKWWQDNNKLLVLTVKPNGNTEFTKIWGSKISQKMKMGWQPSDVELLDTWKWLNSNQLLN